MAESRGNTICELLGISCHQDMSENELNWWLARATRKPFLADQINRFSANGGHPYCIDWWHKSMTEDPAAIEALKTAQKNLEEKRRLQNG